ncbi:HAAS domain-containing protein [Lederbergia galactosidilytica]|uniref:HAAS transmembrane region domain-containing protein n=1 Tax=Lederbergia galactosidilytica TaxID=217031 RepID=A0A0Q9Y7Z7_9BACI|nr:hypothetical protein [Lederbergia galactosidilytica]KRG14883.1 hypothetical protein ACA30_09440 [Virgibacillus soli]KRG16924.1 hypothetical protein ACA29_02350 [Lederbergia galactosidilytica]MBP1914565.1 DNA-binding ferritin-like protein (Dps family)/putative effector of murein hydrolase LrgA (UPF0299 family) [Lederbergia galactosidilytica]OAK69130.1 hypothetical protein ABB05_14300 [Lederbergia galactosidilytica]
MEEYQLSKDSKKFIEDLRVYLFTKGKNIREIDDTIQELADHLYDAERNGKSVKKVVGKSPKEYMENISTEMSNDFKSWWFKYIPLIILGAISFPVMDDLIKGQLSYTILQVIGYIIFSIVFIVGTFTALRFSSKNQLSKTKEYFLLAIPGSISMLLLLGILLFDKAIDAPAVNFGIWGNLALAVLMILFIIGFSVWAKTAILPLILIAWYLPPLGLSYSPLRENMQSTIGTILSITIIGLYLVFVFQEERDKD